MLSKFWSQEDNTYTFVEDTGLVQAIPLYHLQHFFNKSFFRYMSSSLCSKDNKNKLTFGKHKFKTKYQFLLCFFDGPPTQDYTAKSEKGAILLGMKKNIFNF